MDALTIAILGVVVLLVLLILGQNIGICMMTVGFFGCLVVYLSRGMDIAPALNAALITLKKIPFSQAINYSFMVIPLFVLMGQLSYYSGMSSGLYDMTEKGYLGGLTHNTVRL